MHHTLYLLLYELLVAPPHLVLHVLKSNSQQEALEVSVVAVLRSHNMTRAPRVPADQHGSSSAPQDQTGALRGVLGHCLLVGFYVVLHTWFDSCLIRRRQTGLLYYIRNRNTHSRAGSGVDAGSGLATSTLLEMTAYGGGCFSPSQLAVSWKLSLMPRFARQARHVGSAQYFDEQRVKMRASGQGRLHDLAWTLRPGSDGPWGIILCFHREELGFRHSDVPR